ncbi:hypothetical protein, partial [Shewanella mangrovi]|uniref:hypothetical protein n=1 Tax=Shewanella mangrovi TaxID=1515746 RepID=UPI0019D3C4BC
FQTYFSPRDELPHHHLNRLCFRAVPSQWVRIIGTSKNSATPFLKKKDRLLIFSAKRCFKRQNLRYFPILRDLLYEIAPQPSPVLV